MLQNAFSPEQALVKSRLEETIASLQNVLALPPEKFPVDLPRLGILLKGHVDQIHEHSSRMMFSPNRRTSTTPLLSCQPRSESGISQTVMSFGK